MIWMMCLAQDNVASIYMLMAKRLNYLIMTLEESMSKINDVWKKMDNHFASKVPNPVNYPKCFTYYLNLYKIDKENGRTN